MTARHLLGLVGLTLSISGLIRSRNRPAACRDHVGDALTVGGLGIAITSVFLLPAPKR